ncbi:hypothetical protein S140_41 [Shewanella sp. phage 1/40]|nr:hypothetical protein S14_44 [Shewanella sp. phage 1/4]YP_009104042.1 hypothetical protein S140_41 [Shewanella sp. phage 1/40]AHK11156.1 hypothetical protein S14_44 [Shewanella sp. phage 1/4]AHK11451.1 hypothetical protein S140_41 [Shewanella sp. phage 1/40]
MLPQRNQFGMIVIVNEDGEIVKNTKTVTAAAMWIIEKTSKGE